MLAIGRIVDDHPHLVTNFRGQVASWQRAGQFGIRLGSQHRDQLGIEPRRHQFLHNARHHRRGLHEPFLQRQHDVVVRNHDLRQRRIVQRRAQRLPRRLLRILQRRTRGWPATGHRHVVGHRHA